MKIAQYQEVYKILGDKDLSATDKAIWFWAILKKVDYDYVYNNVPHDKLKKFFASFQNIKADTVFYWYRIGWRFYRLQLNPFKSTSGDVEGVKALAVNEDSLVENLHEIMATYTIRKDRSREKHKELAEKIRNNVDVGKALAVAYFFLNSYEQLKETRLKRLVKLTKKMEKINKKLQAQT